MLQAFDIDLLDSSDRPVGTLHLRCRHNRTMLKGQPLLVQHPERREGVLLLEEAEYLYEVRLPFDASVTAQPAEVLDADDARGLRGRLRPRQFVGELPVVFETADGRPFRCRLEVRSRKLDYDSDYRTMLASIARESAELLMHRFGPAVLDAFAPSLPADPKTLYQRFAFLQSLLSSAEFEAAMAVIRARPHTAFDSEVEERPLRRGVRSSSVAVRQLARAEAMRRAGIGVPADVAVAHRRFEATTDTEPNRFVRMAVEHWRSAVARVLDALDDTQGAAAERGRREAGELLNRLDEMLAVSPLRESGRLTHFPVANQVLQKREGYREVLAGFFQTELAAQLDWDGADDIFEAGRRDVATLYEYWCFLQLRRILERLCGGGFDPRPLFELADRGLSLVLKRRKECVLTGSVVRHGRRIELELWFNRHFAGGGAESWSRSMRPDCSIRITADKAISPQSNDFWLHFDAKYRADHLAQILADDVDDVGDRNDADDQDSTVVSAAAKRGDLLKMHAYRDAIKRSAGAYVLFPGDESAGVALPMYTELLPGLGAFPMRVGADGDADTSSATNLFNFLDEVVSHAANQATQHERLRYWGAKSSSGARDLVEAVAFLKEPPADTLVLLGYVRSPAHLSWIRERRLYNLRGDDRTGSVKADSSELAARLVVIYGDGVEAEIWSVRGSPQVLDRASMLSFGYPGPRSTAYFCLPLGEKIAVEDVPELAARVAAAIERQRDHEHGAPIGIDWATLVGRD